MGKSQVKVKYKIEGNNWENKASDIHVRWDPEHR